MAGELLRSVIRFGCLTSATLVSPCFRESPCFRIYRETLSRFRAPLQRSGSTIYVEICPETKGKTLEELEALWEPETKKTQQTATL